MNQYFATVARGLEALAAQELTELGAQFPEIGFCGVFFQGDIELLYKVNLWARLPFRILFELTQFPCADGDDLFEGLQKIDWSQYLTPELTLAVTVTAILLPSKPNGRSSINSKNNLALDRILIPITRQCGSMSIFIKKSARSA
jgi:23S rRNA G2445 N2-methylase RlmL